MFLFLYASIIFLFYIHFEQATDNRHKRIIIFLTTANLYTKYAQNFEQKQNVHNQRIYTQQPSNQRMVMHPSTMSCGAIICLQLRFTKSD